MCEGTGYAVGIPLAEKEDGREDRGPEGGEGYGAGEAVGGGGSIGEARTGSWGADTSIICGCEPSFSIDGVIADNGTATTG